jgi:hypothetical protein
MKTNSNCCGGTASTPCDSAIAELPRYYPRQLITPDDLTLEQNYFRDRMRRHNRLLHGWGVVCGALVCPVTTTASDGTVTTSPWQVQVQEGYALGPYGDEIILDCKRTVDLRTKGCSGVTGDPCIDVPDPWCSQVFATPTSTSFCVAIKYKQCKTRPVRVQPIGCGCDDNTCEYSRLQDGYEIGILPACPANHQQPPKRDDLFHGDVPACPDCPPQPWVVLAVVNTDANGSITSIDNCSCRRLVVSFAEFWWQCTGTVTITDVFDPNNPTKKPIPVTADGKTTATARVTGTNLDPQATYTFGNGVTVTNVATEPNKQPGTSVDLTVMAATDATPGDRTLTIVSADCSVAIKTKAITVVAATAAPSPSPAPRPSPTPAPTPAPRPTPSPAPVRTTGRTQSPKKSADTSSKDASGDSTSAAESTSGSSKGSKN